MTRKQVLSGLAVAGLVAWRMAAVQQPQQDVAAESPAPAALPEAPPAPAPRAGFRWRLATSATFAVLFFAGAALAAGAGNELVSVDPGSTDTAAVVTGTPTDAATTDVTTPDGTTTDAATTDVATTDEVATTATDAVTTDATDPVDTVEAVAADTTDASPTVPVETTAPVSEAPAPTPVARPPHAPKHAVALHVVTHPAPALASPVLSPFPTIAFDPQAWLTEHPGSPAGNAVVAIAESYLGVPYRWGGNTPASGFDCSGLTQFVYAQLGVWLPHYAAAQFLAYPRLDPSDLEPGDLVFFEPKADGPGHVAIYAGNGQIVEAPHTGAVVRLGSLAGAAASLGFLGAVRPTERTLALVVPSRTSGSRFVAE